MISQEQKDQLIVEAKKALGNPYPKNDKGGVYAGAVITDSGSIYSAANYNSDTGSLTLHGEQSALAHAAAHGEGTILAMVITSSKQLEKGEFTAPCHMCKQLMWESRLNSGVLMEVILVNNHDEIKEVNLDELMLLPWPAKRKLN